MLCFHGRLRSLDFIGGKGGWLLLHIKRVSVLVLVHIVVIVIIPTTSTVGTALIPTDNCMKG